MSAVTMFAAVPGVGGGIGRFRVEGEAMQFGLVLHPSIVGINPGGQSLADDGRMSISDPQTGCRIVWGGSRAKAIHNLQVGIDMKGGPDAFQRELQACRAAFIAKHGQSMSEQSAEEAAA